MTKEEATTNLPEWLDMAAHSPTFGEYDKLCREAYSVLGDEEYAKIWKQWSSGYVSCSDGYYRRK